MTTALDQFEKDHEAILAFVADDGFPMAAPATVSVDGGRLSVAARAEVPASSEVAVTVSHIRPQPGVGYDQRRYTTAWGRYEAGTVGVASSTGWDEETVTFFEYCERSVPRGNAYLEKLSEERGYPVKPKLSPGWRFFLATRVPFLSATVIPVFLGAVIARFDGFSAWWYVMLALLGASAIHLGLNVVNDIFDEEADDANTTPTPFSGGSRMIQYGLVSRRQMGLLAGTMFGAGIGIGLLLCALRGWSLLWLGVPGVLLAYFYTAPPVRLAYRGIGDTAVALGFGPITVLGAYFVAAQQFSWGAAVASIPVALFVMLILYVNQIPDRTGDAIAGKRTLAVRLSKKAIVGGYLISALMGFAVIPAGVITGLMPWPTLIGLVGLPLAWIIWRRIDRDYDEPYALMGAMGYNIGLHALVGVALIAGYLIAS